MWNPTVDQAKDGKKAKVIQEIKSVMAKDQAQVTLLAAREIPKEYLEDLDQIQIAVRPF